MVVASVLLPDKHSFPFEGTFLNAAYTHPWGLQAAAALDGYAEKRIYAPTQQWPETNSRDAAVREFADLINAHPNEIAVVPSTMVGENLIAAAVGLGASAGVLTDAFHYDASLAMYGELNRRGVPVSIAQPRGNNIALSDLEALLQRDTRLVSLSHVSSMTGFEHDLKSICDLAHSNGSLVYADIIQAAGAIPIDVKSSGIDFCCCGMYKWLMGDFGAAFLYVRSDRLQELGRVQFGWRQIQDQELHAHSFDSAGPAMGTWSLGNDTASRFEVSTPNWAALSIAVSTISYIRRLGVERIQGYRQPLLDLLQEELPKVGYSPLTPPLSRGPIASFSYENARNRLAAALREANIEIQLFDNAIRVSPSIYNDIEDIERLLAVLTRL
jgi:selenocysteine lyase/cysteine desulfurase